jgi:hypothetical protein
MDRCRPGLVFEPQGQFSQFESEIGGHGPFSSSLTRSNRPIVSLTDLSDLLRPAFAYSGQFSIMSATRSNRRWAGRTPPETAAVERKPSSESFSSS